MDRESLYKGKSKDSDEWFYGHYIKEPVFNGKNHKPTEDKYWIRENNKGQLSIVMVEVKKETVGQFIGARDSKGVKVFEGDIIKYKEAYYPSHLERKTIYAKVKFNKEYTMFEFDNQWENADTWEEHDVLRLGVTLSEQFNWCDTEVIGNMTDNKDLLDD